jgi:predicted CoA-substrate-specific enzyme activase
MISAGIDIGSRTIKLVLIENNSIVFSKVVDNSFNPIETCTAILNDVKYDKICATGYGRHLFAEHFESEVITEIKAFALGINYLFPKARTILDIGGQDTKAIAIDENGHIKKFEMNDKCAAGTGRFLEIMAMAMRFNLSEFAEHALKAESSANINNMCAVFAESEIISMLSKGEDRSKISRGIHQSVVKRSMALMKRVGVKSDIAFAGGGAKNTALAKLLEDNYKQSIYVPEDPQIVGALGCAISVKYN